MKKTNEIEVAFSGILLEGCGPLLKNYSKLSLFNKGDGAQRAKSNRT
jgi:hypothetical protein